ncbi:BTB/POZ domain-containing protein [Colletotrichum musicola]|uniref:BTB/POZ domain-containing protein n=1 Tax=Colletotrichum musicola TaxID=2175873 RepID=A0A8H6KVM3_9PEZI|nr:BTB/POZ domain-containing protein [Colletotrichum musicola]
MTDQAVEELRSSLKSLYEDSQYSDLTIASRDCEYPVHKAIVCPRSEYFAAQCRDSGTKPARSNYLHLPDDDPQAIRMVVRYLYLLDYTSEPTPDAPDLNGLTNGLTNGHSNGHSNGHAHINGHDNDSSTNGGDQEYLSGTSVKADEPTYDKAYKTEKEDTTEPLDDFLPTQPQRLSKKQKKRNKAAKHEAERIGSPDPQNESLSSPISPEVPAASISNAQENHSEGGGASLDAKPSAPNGVKPLANGTQETKSLILHANVYALSRKYGIAGLRSLAFDKFQAEADSQWHTEEFLRAAERVYTSCGGDGDAADEDREMKDVVVGMICRHGELMDNAETQKVIRTLPKDLMYDILMRVRVQGGFVL